MKLDSLYKDKKIILLLSVFSLCVSIVPYLFRSQKVPKTDLILPEAELATETTYLNDISLPRKFQITFPSPPSYSFQNKLLPKISQKPITLHQYIATEETAEYKVYATILPQICFRWSKKIILKRALQILTKNAISPKKILSTTFKKSENYPILEYTLKEDARKIQTIGKLILVENSIYLIEVSIPEIELTPDYYEKITQFFQSFELSS